MTALVVNRTLTRDMPDRSRVVALLGLRESGDPDNPRALVRGLSPAFSLIGDLYQPRNNASGAARERNYARIVERGGIPGPRSEPDGASRAEIVRAFPQLQRFADMHLANPWTGEPLHALANSWYFYAGSRADLRASETYTGFNGVYAWQLAERGLSDDDRGREEYCYQIACSILRVDEIPRELDKGSFGRFVDDLRECWRYDAIDARTFILSLPETH